MDRTKRKRDSVTIWCSHCGDFLSLRYARNHLALYWSKTLGKWKQSKKKQPLKPAIDPAITIARALTDPVHPHKKQKTTAWTATGAEQSALEALTIGSHEPAVLARGTRPKRSEPSGYDVNADDTNMRVDSTTTNEFKRPVHDKKANGGPAAPLDDFDDELDFKHVASHTFTCQSGQSDAKVPPVHVLSVVSTTL